MLAWPGQGILALTGEAADRLREAELTYREVGSTAGELPPGYRHLRRSAVIGSGAAAFNHASDALLGWQAHLRAGLRVSPSSPTAEPGTVVLLELRAGPARLLAPCRVIYVTDEPGRRGFAYGTLPGHPECGEEAFIVERCGNGSVSFTITAFTRHATPLARADGPVARAIRRHISTRYLRALAT